MACSNYSRSLKTVFTSLFSAAKHCLNLWDLTLNMKGRSFQRDQRHRAECLGNVGTEMHKTTRIFYICILEIKSLYNSLLEGQEHNKVTQNTCETVKCVVGKNSSYGVKIEDKCFKASMSALCPSDVTYFLKRCHIPHLQIVYLGRGEIYNALEMCFSGLLLISVSETLHNDTNIFAMFYISTEHTLANKMRRLI